MKSITLLLAITLLMGVAIAGPICPVTGKAVCNCKLPKPEPCQKPKPTDCGSELPVGDVLDSVPVPDVIGTVSDAADMAIKICTLTGEPDCKCKKTEPKPCQKPKPTDCGSELPVGDVLDSVPVCDVVGAAADAADMAIKICPLTGKPGCKCKKTKPKPCQKPKPTDCGSELPVGDVLDSVPVCDVVGAAADAADMAIKICPLTGEPGCKCKKTKPEPCPNQPPKDCGSELPVGVGAVDVAADLIETATGTVDGIVDTGKPEGGCKKQRTCGTKNPPPKGKPCQNTCSGGVEIAA